MAKEFLQRMYDPGQENVSFAIGKNKDFFLVDAPLTPGAVMPTEESLAVLYSHFHKDHCPQEKSKRKMPNALKLFNPTTLILLDHIGVRTDLLSNIRHLTPEKKTKIEGFGTIIPIAVSHSSIDAMAFWIELDSGNTVFYSGDIRSGNRTDRAIETVRKLAGIKGVSLFIGDATGVGKEHISQQDHLHRLKEALRLAEKNKAGTAIFVKAGDYGNIAFWFENRVFKNCEVFLSPQLQRVLGPKNLNWLSYLSSRYGYTPPDINWLEESLRLGKKTVFLYDNQWKNQITGKHVLINASRKEIPYKSDYVIAVFPIGFSGHSSEAFYNLLQACNPEHIAYLHPPQKGKPRIGQREVVMKKRGSIFEL